MTTINDLPIVLRANLDLTQKALAERLGVSFVTVNRREGGGVRQQKATQSIGMMRRARDIESKQPGSVVFLDFGDRDFDEVHSESYLFDDDGLRALAALEDSHDKINELLDKKESIRTARPDDAPDDLKPSSGQIYVTCTNILGLTQPRNDARSFMRGTLAFFCRHDYGCL